MPSIEEAYASLQLETVSYGLNACKKGGHSSYDDRVAAGDLPWVDAARALALAAHDDACLACHCEPDELSTWCGVSVEDIRRECPRRKRIEALGKEGT